MKLYLITRDDEAVGYDEAEAFLVAARDRGHARRLIAASDGFGLTVGDEGVGPWLDKTRHTCDLIGESPDSDGARVILRSFRAG